MNAKQRYENYVAGWQDAVNMNFMSKTTECKEAYEAGFNDGYTARKKMKQKATRKYKYQPPIIRLQS